MQECFRKYPEVYSAELADDEEAAEGAPASTESAPSVNSDGDAIAAPEKVAPRASAEEKVQEKPAETQTEEKKIETKTAEPAPAPAEATESVPAEVPTKFSDATEENKKSE